MNISASGADFAFLVIPLAIVTSIFWLVVGWRAMRAHERIADAVAHAAKQLPVRGE